MDRDEHEQHRVSDVTNAEFWNDEYEDDPDAPCVPDWVLGDAIAALPPGRALDLGCGRGLNALMLARRGWSVHGVDWSEEAIRLAREAAAAEGLDATFEVADVTQWAPSEPVQLAINTFALWEGDTGLATLRNLADALAPGGTAIVLEWDRCMAEGWGWGETPEYFPTPERVVSGLAGLTIEVAETRRIAGVLADPDDDRHTEDGDAHVVFVRARKPSP